MLPSFALSDREKRILKYIETVETIRESTFDEICRALSGYGSRRSIRKSLDRLIKRNLIMETKAKRGQRTIHVLRKNLTAFAKYSLLSFEEWEGVQQHFQKLNRIIKDDEFDTETKVLYLTSFVCRAVLITERAALIDNNDLTTEMKKGLLKYSLNRLRKLLEETSELVRPNQSVVTEFERVSMKFLSSDFEKGFQAALVKLMSPPEK
jgi:predicted transcriptional regulator